MSSLPQLSVRQPVLVNLLVILTIVGGAFGYRAMAKERVPSVQMEAAIIQTMMPGASAKEIEQLLTIPLEEEIAKVDEIDFMEGTSAEGVSIIFVRFEESIDSLFKKVTELQNQVELVSDLPADAEDPVVKGLKVKFDTIRICLLGNAPELILKEFAEDLADDLKKIDGVDEVNIDGIREREIWIETDPYRLQAFGLSLGDVAEALRMRNMNVPGGSIKMGRAEILVRTEAEFVQLDEISGTIITQDGEGGFVYVRDVAEVVDRFEEPVSYARLNGQDAVIITVKKDRRSNVLPLVENVRAAVEEIRPRTPPGITIQFVEDTSIEVRHRLNGLYLNFSVGLTLVLISLTLFIGWRAAAMVAFGIPIAFLGTFALMNAIGLTVNMISLFSLILVLGLIVDDSIVVCENVYRHMEGGLPIKEAAVKGTEEITLPVIATVLTTIAAFVPLLLMSGPLGKFMGIIPVVVTMALTASLGECLFVLPSHIVEFGASESGSGVDHDHKIRPWVTSLMNVYRRFIRAVLRFRYVAVAMVIAVAFFAVNLAKNHMDFVLFGGRDMESFSLQLEGPPSSSLGETMRIISELEEKALAIGVNVPEIETLRLRAGSIFLNNLQGDSRRTNIGELAFRLVPMDQRNRMGQSVREEFRSIIGEVSGARNLTFVDTREGPPVGKPVLVRVKGNNFETLREIADNIKHYLHTVEGVIDISDSFPPGKDEIRPVFDTKKLAQFDLDMAWVAREVRGAFDGIDATTVHDGKEEIDVVVKYDRAYRSSVGDISELVFSTPQGLVPFSNLGHIERQKGFSSISHYNQKRTINVTADVIEGVATSKAVNEELQRAFADIPRNYPGYSLDFGGEFEDTQESLDSLFKAFILTMILIYVILGGLFQSFVQPLIVMFAVPFSFVGVVMGFYLMDEPLGMLAIIGVIALAGIVVNDSLIFIEFINARRRAGEDPLESIVESGATRLRPIILTSITTILGLMPMALGLFGIDQMLLPMALAIVWGLSFATVLTLVVIPCVYKIVDDMTQLVVRRPLGLSREQHEALKQSASRADAPTGVSS